MKQKFHYLNGEINISDICDKLPQIITDMFAEAESHDRDNDLGTLVADCDDIEVWTKLLIPNVISKREWERICQRYTVC